MSWEAAATEPTPESEASAPQDAGRKPPQDIMAEQSVLGGMLLNKDAIADAVEEVRGRDFYRPAHEMIFDAIVDLFSQGEPADVVTVKTALDKKGQLEQAGGSAYLHELTSTVPVVSNSGYYAGIIADLAMRRRLIDAATRIATLGYAGGEVDTMVNEAQAEIYGVNDKRESQDYAFVGEVVEATMDELEALNQRESGLAGVPTGFSELDEYTNGLQGGQMVVIAARPAIGKSTVGLDIARSCSLRHGLTSMIFSLEMSKSEIVTRLLSAEGQVMLHKMRNGELDEQDWGRLARSMGEIADKPLIIDDSPNMTLMEIRAKCRRVRQQHDLRLVVIDYLQLMTSGKKVESRQQEVSEFSRSLKLMAKELDVPVIAISQLNRGPEQRTDKRPAMSDLRESGAIEQDADMIILLHREDAYDRETRPGEADLILAKNRNGRTADVTVTFQGHYSRFVDMPKGV